MRKAIAGSDICAHVLVCAATKVVTVDVLYVVVDTVENDNVVVVGAMGNLELHKVCAGGYLERGGNNNSQQSKSASGGEVRLAWWARQAGYAFPRLMRRKQARSAKPFGTPSLDLSAVAPKGSTSA